MKVLLSLLGSITITSSSVGLVSSNVLVEQKQQENKLTDSTNQIDWTMVKENTNNYFDELKAKQLFSSDFTPDKANEIFNYAQQQSLVFAEKFSSQNLTLDEIINEISEQFPNFKKVYNSKILETQNNFYSFSEKTSSIIDLTNIDYVKQLTEIVKEIKTADDAFFGISIAAAVAAAGFWAAAWWFGISVPWAIACTNIAATTGFISSILSEVTTQYNKQSSELTDAKFALDFINWIGGILFGALVSAEVFLAANIWAFAVTAVLIPIIGIILSQLNDYQ